MPKFSSVHHSSGGLLVLLQHPAGVGLWQFLSRRVVTSSVVAAQQNYNSSKVLSLEPCYCYGMIRNNYLIILIGCMEFIIYF